MEMYQIRYFLAVCETLNFTRAAEKCYVSQPSLTKAIQKLEDTLGGRLFDRTKNSVQMTELGRIMQPNLAQLYSSARQAKEQARNFMHSQHSKLTMGVMCTICLDPLVGMLADFQTKYPKVELHFDSGKFEELCDAIDKGEIDIAILASPYEFPKRFDTVPLYREDFVIACPPNHRFISRGTIALSDLDKERYVVRDNCEYADYIGDMLEELGVALDIRHTTEREDWIQTMIRAGMGIAFMPENSCVAAGLSLCRIPDPHIQRDIQILTLANKEKSQPVQTFIDQAMHYDWRSATESLRNLAA